MKRKPTKFQDIKIVSGIPIPKKKNSSKFNDVLKRMNIGDSFRWNTSSLSGIFRCAKILDIKLTSRKVSEFPESYQIWRIE